jgi:hypothetical protein
MNMIPPELKKYSNNPEDIPLELEQKYSEIHFSIMSNLIVKPKKTKEWWKQNATMGFIKLFNDKLAEIVEKTTKEAENFRSARKGKR